MNNNYRNYGAGMLLAIAATSVQAVEMPSIFGTHMVMQRAAKAPVWGWAPAGAKITVEFGRQVKKAATDAEGKWKIVLDPMQANGNPQVPKPVAARYAFSTNPEGCNLYNNEGLPAAPFRTDEC